MKIMHHLVRCMFPSHSIRRVWWGALRGIRYKVCPESSMGFSFALAVDAFHQKWFQNHVRPGMTVWDIGANRGQMTLYFSKWVGLNGRVVAFEPCPQLMDDLRFNIALNRMENVTTHGLAVGSRSGKASFAFDFENQTSGRLVSGVIEEIPSQKVFDVESISLDDYLLKDQWVPDILKIDVEGGAGAVLEGAGKLLDLHSPQIYIELHDGEEQRAIVQHLLNRGYLAKTLDGKVVPDPSVGWHNPLWCIRERGSSN